MRMTTFTVKEHYDETVGGYRRKSRRQCVRWLHFLPEPEPEPKPDLGRALRS
jgi:hypothetical protein